MIYFSYAKDKPKETTNKRGGKEMFKRKEKHPKFVDIKPIPGFDQYPLGKVADICARDAGLINENDEEGAAKFNDFWDWLEPEIDRRMTEEVRAARSAAQRYNLLLIIIPAAVTVATRLVLDATCHPARNHERRAATPRPQDDAGGDGEHRTRVHPQSETSPEQKARWQKRKDQRIA